MKRWRRPLRAGADGLLLKLAAGMCALSVGLVTGCQARSAVQLRPGAENAAKEEEPLPPSADNCVCTPVAPFGFDGPSIVGRGPALASIECPEDASLPGFAGVLIATAEWARECRITPLTTCSASGWVCAPPPPESFSLCIYRGEEFACPPDYPRTESVIEADGLKPLKNVTLCCAQPAIPG